MEQHDMFDKEIKSAVQSSIQSPSSDFSMHVMNAVTASKLKKERLYRPLLIPIVAFVATLLVALLGESDQSWFGSITESLDGILASIAMSKTLIYSLVCLSILLIIQVPMINRKVS